MKSQLYIKPRRSGKTTELINRFKEDVIGIYVTVNTNGQRYLIEEFGVKNNGCVITQEQLVLSSMHLGNKKCHLYLDEYFHYDINAKRSIFNAYMLNKISVTAMGTPNKQYDRGLINDLRNYWAFQKARKFVNILHREEDLAAKFGDDLVYSLLVAPSVELIHPTDNTKQFLSQEQFEMDMLGQIYKGEVTK